MATVIEYRQGDTVSFRRLLEPGETHHAFTQDKDKNLVNSYIIGSHVTGLAASIFVCDEVGRIENPNDDAVILDLLLDSYEIDTVLRGEEKLFALHDPVLGDELGSFTLSVYQLIDVPSFA